LRLLRKSHGKKYLSGRLNFMIDSTAAVNGETKRH